MTKIPWDAFSLQHSFYLGLYPLTAAAEEMPVGYADKMIPVINNVPALVIALILVIPFALLSLRFAESIMKKVHLL